MKHAVGRLELFNEISNLDFRETPSCRIFRQIIPKILHGIVQEGMVPKVGVEPTREVNLDGF